MDIRYIKFHNGQEIVAKMADKQNEDKDTFSIDRDAALLWLMEGEGGQPAMNISPFCPFTDQDTIEMKHSDCLFNVKANDELSEFYKQATKKSSLVTPPKKSIIMP